jgi:hypothetical protein
MEHDHENLASVEGATKSLTDSLHLKSEPVRAHAARWRWVVFPLVLFVVTRMALLVFAQVTLLIEPDLWDARASRDFLPDYPAPHGLCRWDCHFFFTEIARRGYFEPRATNFFPLYPLLARALHEVTGIPLLLALLTVANVAGLAALVVIYQLFTRLAGERAARSALLLFAAYPFAFFQAAGYPESLMSFFSALGILLALRGQHIWAGLALGFGVLARHLSLLADAALLVAQIRQRGLHPARLLLRPALIGLLVPWLFLGLYLLYLWMRFGDALAFSAARHEWGAMAWWGIWDLIRTRDCPGCAVHVPVMWTYVLFALLPTSGALLLATRKQWAELASFAIIYMIVVWSIGMWALGRYSAGCWPAFLPFGVWLAKRPAMQGAVIVILALFQGLFFYLYVHQGPIL